MVFKRKQTKDPERIEFEQSEEEPESEFDEEEEPYEDETVMKKAEPKKEQKEQKQQVNASEWFDIIQGNAERTLKTILDARRFYNI